MYLCDNCSERAHSHKDRATHRPERCGELAEAGELELLSVICIETSHYVCFTKDIEGKWVFSDSMANRLCEWYWVVCHGLVAVCGLGTVSSCAHGCGLCLPVSWPLPLLR